MKKTAFFMLLFIFMVIVTGIKHVNEPSWDSDWTFWFSLSGFFIFSALFLLDKFFDVVDELRMMMHTWFNS